MKLMRNDELLKEADNALKTYADSPRETATFKFYKGIALTRLKPPRNPEALGIFEEVLYDPTLVTDVQDSLLVFSLPMWTLYTADTLRLPERRQRVLDHVRDYPSNFYGKHRFRLQFDREYRARMERAGMEPAAP